VLLITQSTQGPKHPQAIPVRARPGIVQGPDAKPSPENRTARAPMPTTENGTAPHAMLKSVGLDADPAIVADALTR